MEKEIMIAPMLDWTDRHYRYFMRLMSKKVRLYTEMITTGALIHGNAQRFLDFDDKEHPIVLQLGGNNPQDLALCARMAEDYAYDEVNLNVGCPSSQVQSGRFGACLMKEGQLVADLIAAMQDKVNIPISVKTRIGVDEFDSYEFLQDFIGTIASTGCNKFIIHARKAWLNGLSPKQNRTIPELKYDYVLRLKEHFPTLHISINGGFIELEDIEHYLNLLDGVMIGREAYHNPYKFVTTDNMFYGGDNSLPTRLDIACAMLPYVSTMCAQGVRLHSMTRHMLGLFHGAAGARSWRRYLTINTQDKNAGVKVLEGAIDLMKNISP